MEDMFTILPHEDIIFSNIMSYLKFEDIFRMRRVSSTWTRCVQNYFDTRGELDLTKLHRGMYPPILPLSAFRLMMQNNSNFRSLKFSCLNWLTTEELIPVIRRSSNLSVIFIDRCREVHSKVLHEISESCTQLTALSIPACFWNAAEAKSFFLATVKKNPSIIKLDVCGNIFFDEECLIATSTSCIDMQSLNISHLKMINDENLFKAVKCFSSLTHLAVQNCENITANGLKRIMEVCQHLEELDTQISGNITSEFLREVTARGIRVLSPHNHMI